VSFAIRHCQVLNVIKLAETVGADGEQLASSLMMQWFCQCHNAHKLSAASVYACGLTSASEWFGEIQRM
jgi:L-cysteine desulfidase